MERFQTLTTVDYVFLGLLIGGAIYGWIQGLVRILAGFLAFAASFFIAGRYTHTVVDWLNGRFGLEQRISAAIAAKIQVPAAQTQIPGTSVRSAATEYIKGLPLPEAYKDTLVQRIAAETTLRLADLPRFVADQLAGGVLSTLVFVVLVVLLGILFVFVARLLGEHIKEIPLVGMTNRLLGSGLILSELLVLLALAVGLVIPTLALYGGVPWLRAFDEAQLRPALLTVYTWTRSILFGLTGGAFFAV